MALPEDQLVKIPRSSVAPEISGRQQLEGGWWGLRFVFSSRDRRWYLDVAADDGTVLVRGLRVSCGVALLGHLSDSRLPPGQLFVEDSGGLGRAPDRDAWQSWATLYYRPRAVVLGAAGTEDEVP